MVNYIQRDSYIIYNSIFCRLCTVHIKNWLPAFSIETYRIQH